MSLFFSVFRLVVGSLHESSLQEAIKDGHNQFERRRVCFSKAVSVRKKSGIENTRGGKETLNHASRVSNSDNVCY
ncbi:unnamed protein product [Citrullus colocynthis]|uniref:Secreted protein n=1 Tax=Citrullus colocynthis TaxID=252529 RepID=A0ABP0Y0K5_9ROSI